MSRMFTKLVLACLSMYDVAFGLIVHSRSWQADEQQGAVSPESSDGRKKPHIVFVLMDDLGWRDLGFRDSNIATPTFDRLAREGVVLENYYVLSTCAPTRAALMTGRHAHQTGVYMPYAGNDPWGLPSNETTLPSLLQQAGYRTHMVGKWHLGFAKEEFTPTFRGFQTFYGFYGWGEDYFTHREKYPNAEDWALDFRREEQSRCGAGCSVVEHNATGKYSTYLFTERAIKVIQDHDASAPLFLYLAWQAAHGPRACPNWADKQNLHPTQVWPGCPASPPAHFPFPYYTSSRPCGDRDETFCRVVADADHGMSQILDALQAKSMLQDTVIVFSTDNGGPVNAPTPSADAIGSSNWPLRGGKHTLYEGGVRAVGFVWSGTKAPKVSRGNYSGLMHCVDWLPTLVSLAGGHLTSVGQLTGRDQWTALSSSGTSPHDHLLLAVQPSGEDCGPYGGDESWALRKGPYKLILGCPGKSIDAYGWSEQDGVSSHQPNVYPVCNATSIAIYNVETDIREERNLAANGAGIENELLSLVELYRTSRVPWDYARLRPESAQAELRIGSPLDGVWAPWM